MILGTLNPEKIRRGEHLTHLSTSPVRCSHFTLGNPRVIFQQIYDFRIEYSRYLTCLPEIIKTVNF